MARTRLSHNPDTSIPPAFEIVAAALRPAFEACALTVSRFDDCLGSDFADVEEIPTAACDGFIPYTDGGFRAAVPAWLKYAHGSGRVPGPIKPYLSNALKDAREAFQEERGVDPYELTDETPEGVALLETWYEFEDEYMTEDATYHYNIRAIFYDADNSRNVTGEAEVYFWAALNTDFGYNRDYIPWIKYYGITDPNQSRAEFEKTVTVRELAENLDLAADIMDEIRAHLEHL